MLVAHHPARPQVCDFRVQPVRRRPFPHVLRDKLIHPDAYRQLAAGFPTCPPASGPTGFSLYAGDPAYEALLHEQPAWQDLHSAFHSQTFVDYCLAQFGPYWRQEGCLIDLTRACYTDYQEDRIDKERRHLRKVTLEPYELWVRMDIYQGRVGYSRPVHVDHRRRLISLLVYFCDADVNGMDGGNLVLHPSGKPTFFSRFFPAIASVTPRHNRMVMFPCCARSLHSVTPIVAQRGPRNYIQVTLSSSVDAWT